MRHARTLSLLTAAPLLATSLVAAALTAPAQAATGHTPVWDRGAGGERYVALGDSFVSGPGITEQRPGECTRSERNFPSVVAADLGVQSFTDASCGGAKVADLWQPQRDNAPQLDALSADTSLVTFGMLGGNDVGLVGLAYTCVVSDIDCAGTPNDANHDKVEALRQPLTDGVREARVRAPGATIAMVGYGTYLPPGGCPENPELQRISAGEADYFQGLIDHLSDLIGEVAAAEGAEFVDLRDVPGALDHTACAAPEDQWIRAINGHGDGSTLHPSSAGMAATAAHVAAVVRSAWAETPGRPIPVPEPTRPPAPTPTTDPAPTPAPATLTPAEVQAALVSAQESVRARAWCARRPTDRRVVAMRVRGGKGLVAKVVFRVGSERLKKDRSAPYVVKRRAGSIRRTRGRMWARVTVSSHGQSLAQRHAVKRPRCARR